MTLRGDTVEKEMFFGFAMYNAAADIASSCI